MPTGTWATNSAAKKAPPAQPEVTYAYSDRGFALASVLPSKRAMSWTFASAILLLLLLVPVASHLMRSPAKPDPTGKTPGTVLMDSAWTSGELSLKHHSLEDNCESCHVAAFESVQDETCVSCHKDTGDHAPMGRLAKGRRSPVRHCSRASPPRMTCTSRWSSMA